MEDTELVPELVPALTVIIKVLDGVSATTRVLGFEVVPELMRVLTFDVDIFVVASELIGVLE